MREFLEEQEKKLAARTFSYHKDALDMLEHSINGYGPNGLDDENYKKWQKNYDKGIEYCDTFGPEFISDSDFVEFLGYFYPKKVAVGRDSARKVCGATVNYFKWMVMKKYIKLEEDGDAIELREAVRYLRKSFEDGMDEYCDDVGAF